MQRGTSTCNFLSRQAPMATATPHSFPGGVVTDSSGVIGPSATISICFQPVRRWWGNPLLDGALPR